MVRAPHPVRSALAIAAVAAAIGGCAGGREPVDGTAARLAALERRVAAIESPTGDAGPSDGPGPEAAAPGTSETDVVALTDAIGRLDERLAVLEDALGDEAAARTLADARATDDRALLERRARELVAAVDALRAELEALRARVDAIGAR